MIHGYDVSYIIGKGVKITTFLKLPILMLSNLSPNTSIWVEIVAISGCRVKGEELELRISAAGT